MNTVLLILLILIVLMTMSRTEMFTEQFGFSGYTKPIDTLLLNSTDTDLSDYEESGEEIEISKFLKKQVFVRILLKQLQLRNIKTKCRIKKYTDVCLCV